MAFPGERFEAEMVGISRSSPRQHPRWLLREPLAFFPILQRLHFGPNDYEVFEPPRFLTLRAALGSLTFVLIVGICRGSIWAAFDKVISGLLSIHSDEVIGY